MQRVNILSLESQQKIAIRDQKLSEKTLNKAKILLNIPKNNKLLNEILKYLYLNLPVNEYQQEHPVIFIDHLYILNYAVTSIMINWKIANKESDAYVNDPDLRYQMMELIYKDDKFTSLKPKQISEKVLQYLAGLSAAFLKMADDIYDLNKTIPLEYLIKLHGGPKDDARDHMSQTCFDRAKLINELLVFCLGINKKEEKPSEQNVVISYLENFYSPKSLKQYLPKDLLTAEEKILANLIDIYEQIAEKKSIQSGARFIFFTPKKSVAQDLYGLLISMQNTIRAYQEIYKEIPNNMKNILWRINGLIPLQAQKEKAMFAIR